MDFRSDIFYAVLKQWRIRWGVIFANMRRESGDNGCESGCSDWVIEACRCADSRQTGQLSAVSHSATWWHWSTWKRKDETNIVKRLLPDHGGGDDCHIWSLIYRIALANNTCLLLYAKYSIAEIRYCLKLSKSLKEYRPAILLNFFKYRPSNTSTKIVSL